MEFRLPARISEAIEEPLIDYHNRLEQKTQANFEFSPLTDLQWRTMRFLINHLDERTDRRVDRVLTSPFRYNPCKTFYPLHLIETEHTYDYSDPNTGLTIKSGDYYLRIHLSPLDPDVSFHTQVRESLQDVAMYVEEFRDRLPSDRLVGLTFDKLAAVSKRFGFTVAETPIPVNIAAKYDAFTKRVFNNMPKEFPIRDFLNARFCFMTFDDLLERYLV